MIFVASCVHHCYLFMIQSPYVMLPSSRNTKIDARGDVFRGLEVVEQACGAGVAMMGETLGGVANAVDTYSYREPLGVCAGEEV